MNELTKKFIKAVKTAPANAPWSFLAKTIPYTDAKFNYTMRKNTMPPAVHLYSIFANAAAAFGSANLETLFYFPPFRMIKKANGKDQLETILEGKLSDTENLLVIVSFNTAAINPITVKASVIDKSASIAMQTPDFVDMPAEMLNLLMLALLPTILTVDLREGNNKIKCAIDDLNSTLTPGVTWQEKADIPEMAQDSVYFLDAIMDILQNHIDITFGAATQSAPDTIPTVDSYPTPGTKKKFSGAAYAEYMVGSDWEPEFTFSNGKKVSIGNTHITISEAKDEFSVYTAHRHWSADELNMIPQLPDDMPVMPEVLRMAKRIVQTKDEPIPVKNLMWRGETGIGKSTGMKQLACLLNIPLVVQACFPSMEAQDFRSILVPAAKQNTPFSADTATTVPQTENSLLQKAIHYLNDNPDTRDRLLSNTKEFFLLALVDQDAAEKDILGESTNLPLEDLCSLFTEVQSFYQSATYTAKIAEMQDQLKADGKVLERKEPAFIHVPSPYMQALIKGYLVEIQEASRIRDPGVLVSINDYECPNARIQLMDGSVAHRHSDALTIITDNVGYAGCRSLEQSVIRRQALIIDNSSLSKTALLERVKRNTGVTDTKLLDTAYTLWLTVKEYCEKNSITEGSVSPVELERFVQAIKFDGEDSIAENLNDCIISKASSSVDDQRDIRSACSTLVNF